jgi:stress-induced morphogen
MSRQDRGSIIHVAFIDYSAQILISDIIEEKMASTKSDSTSSRPNLKCSICGKEFENLGDLQRHTTVEHIQKGELPSKSEMSKS